jgi:hypothetical protein
MCSTAAGFPGFTVAALSGLAAASRCPVRATTGPTTPCRSAGTFRTDIEGAHLSRATPRVQPYFRNQWRIGLGRAVDTSPVKRFGLGGIASRISVNSRSKI